MDNIFFEADGVKVEVQGYADGPGSTDVNDRLSEERADAVLAYLVDELGVPSERLTSKGYGEESDDAGADQARRAVLFAEVPVAPS